MGVGLLGEVITSTDTTEDTEEYSVPTPQLELNVIETIKPFFESVIINQAYSLSDIRIVNNSTVYFPGDEKSIKNGHVTQTSVVIRNLFMTKPEIIIFVAEDLGINLDSSLYIYRNFRYSNPEQ